MVYALGRSSGLRYLRTRFPIQGLTIVGWSLEQDITSKEGQWAEKVEEGINSKSD
jgi:hypothetical protein